MVPVTVSPVPMRKIEDYSFPKGLHLLTRWQADSFL